MTVQIDDLRSADRATLRRASVLGARFTRANLVTALELDESAAEAAIARLDRFLVADGEGGPSVPPRLAPRRCVPGALVQPATRSPSPGRHRNRARSGRGHRRRRRSAHASLLRGRRVGAGASLRPHRRPSRAGRVRERRCGRSARSGVSLPAQDGAAPGTRRSRSRPRPSPTSGFGSGSWTRRGRRSRSRDAAFAVTSSSRHACCGRRRRLRTGSAPTRKPTGSSPARYGCSTASAACRRPSSVRASRHGSEWSRTSAGARETRSRGMNEAIADGEAVGATKALAHALTGLDLAYNAMGDSGRATHGRRALELYDELGDLVSKGGVLNNLGLAAYYAGRWDDAVALYRQALEAWDRAGDTQSVSMAAFNIGEILSAQGHLDEAEPLLRDAERASRAGGSRDRRGRVQHGDRASRGPPRQHDAGARDARRGAAGVPGVRGLVGGPPRRRSRLGGAASRRSVRRGGVCWLKRPSCASRRSKVGRSCFRPSIACSGAHTCPRVERTQRGRRSSPRSWRPSASSIATKRRLRSTGSPHWVTASHPSSTSVATGSSSNSASSSARDTSERWGECASRPFPQLELLRLAAPGARVVAGAGCSSCSSSSCRRRTGS